MADLRDALRPLAERLKPSVREHEILRIAGLIPSQTTLDHVGDVILKWAEKRCGGRLPRTAWQLKNFEYLAGGRNSMAVRLSDERYDLWSLRAEDPDKNIPGRVWTTEVGLGGERGKPIRFSARLLASSPEAELDVQPHSPGFALQIADRFGFYTGKELCGTRSDFIETKADMDGFLEELTSTERALPIIVLSINESTRYPMVDPEEIARAVTGLAHVRVLSIENASRLTDEGGKTRSVFGGAIRIYYPGFSFEESPYPHRLIIAANLQTSRSQELAIGWFRKLAAEFSLSHRKIGTDVIGFRDVKAASVRRQRETQAQDSATDSEKLKSAEELIKTLSAQVEEVKQLNDYYEDEHKKAEERALDAEQRAKANVYQIQLLRDQLKQANALQSDEAEKPNDWADIGDWTDQNLAGRLVLTPKAKRLLKKPKFNDLETVLNCLLWLANECRDRKIDGGDGSLREAEVQDGIRNAHCGSDTYTTRWKDQVYSVDWHIKNGGNTRDPNRCLRIYYFWDEETQQIVVDELPEHRRTDAT